MSYSKIGMEEILQTREEKARNFELNQVWIQDRYGELRETSATENWSLGAAAECRAFIVNHGGCDWTLNTFIVTRCPYPGLPIYVYAINTAANLPDTFKKQASHSVNQSCCAAFRHILPLLSQPRIISDKETMTNNAFYNAYVLSGFKE